MTTKKTMYRQQHNARKQAFSAALNRRMSLAGFDQVGLSSATGIPSDQISRYCNAGAMPRPKTLDILAKALGCSRTDLTSPRTLEQPEGEYMSFRSSANNRVTLELRKQLSLDQANRILEVLGNQGVTA